ncbi:MAG: hypothetical protein ACKVQU_36680 [Burkholderiales bacterium]
MKSEKALALAVVASNNSRSPVEAHAVGSRYQKLMVPERRMRESTSIPVSMALTAAVVEFSATFAARHVPGGVAGDATEVVIVPTGVALLPFPDVSRIDPDPLHVDCSIPYSAIGPVKNSKAVPLVTVAVLNENSV